MKTTVNIPESLYPTLAAASSAEGMSVADYVLKAACEKVNAPPTPSSSAEEDGARLASYFAHLDRRTEEEKKAIHEGVAEVQAIIDDEFSKVDPRDW